MAASRSALIVRAFLVVAALGLLAVHCASTRSVSTCGPGATLLPATPTALPTMDEESFDQLLCQLRGKPVVVNIWASWCGPCIFEAPELAKAAEAYQGQVQFVGVDLQDQLPPARTFIDKYGWVYPSVSDPKGDIRDSFGVIGVPNTLFFDENGRRTSVWSGPVTQEILANGIDGAIRNGGGSPVPSPTSASPSSGGG
jgi:thiol-disulfide isomerase/thioredoxin